MTPSTLTRSIRFTTHTHVAISVQPRGEGLWVRRRKTNDVVGRNFGARGKFYVAPQRTFRLQPETSSICHCIALMLGPIPFPLSTRVGTDLCSVPRITALLQRRLKGMNNPPSQQGSRSFDFAEDLGQATHGLNRSNQPEQLDKFDRWGIRVFNRLEWPEFKERSRDYADLSVVRQSNFERWTAGR